MKHPEREHQRVYFTFYLRIFEGSSLLGFLLDISLKGLMIMSEKELRTGKTYTLSVKVPPVISEDHGDYVKIQSECRWCRRDEKQKDTYLCGFQIEDIQGKGNNLVKKLIDEYRLR
ncbi:MAG: PilZ domain-containing protein [Spirochaetota bacterium]